MSDIDTKFKYLRTNLRKHGTKICEDVFRRFHPATACAGPEICIFCNSTSEITKEHILPKWLFENDTESRFVSSVNRLTQTYNKAIVPCCAICNNNILADIERHLIKALKRIEIAKVFEYEDICNVIKWLQIIDYKTQVFDCRRKFLMFPNSEYDEYWGLFPVAMMRHFGEMDPHKAYDFLRSTQRRISIRTKVENIKSLVIFHTKSPHFNFFIQPNNYIFLSLPMFRVAFFCFFRKRFEQCQYASEKAYGIMHKVFNS
jgi:hypothetical protein